MEPTEEIVRTTCSYCSVGCNIDIVMTAGKPSKVIQAKDYPVNQGRTCTKGFNLLKAYDAHDRATTPLIRNSEGVLEPCSWDQAAEAFATKFKDVQKRYGKSSVAFLSTGQMVIEEMALLGAFAKFGMGLVHGDGNTRQCMASAAVGYKQAFGFDSPPFTYQDAEESDLIIFVGANPMIAHPIIWQRVKANQRNPTIVVIDPRKTETANEANLHLGIAPKSDLYLFYAVANQLIKQNKIKLEFIKAHTNGFDDFKKHVEKFTPELAAEKTGLTLNQINKFISLISEKERVSFWWTMGVNQSHQGVRTIQSIINICLMTGNIGRPGTGPNSITGQTNAMGSRIFSNTTNLIGGHDFTNPLHRKKIADILKIPESNIPEQNSLAYDQILAGIDSGEIKGLWIICTNPAHSWINKHEFYSRMSKLEFLVVQDIYHTTETAKIADLMLPAGGSPEKSGTLINSERRLGIVQKVMDPPGLALADFDIFKRLIKAWGCEEMFKDWTEPKAVFEILKKISKGQPCDISGIPNWEWLLGNRGVQWPYPEGGYAKGSGGGGDWEAEISGVKKAPLIAADQNQRRLFEDGVFYHEDGRAKFLYTEVEQPGELPDSDYPYWLITGRGTMHQFHTQTRTGKVEILRKMYPEHPYVEVSKEDAKLLGLDDSDKVLIESKRGSVIVDVMIKDTMKPGQLFMPMHYPETNWLTFASFDTYSRQPSYKVSSVRIFRAASDHPRGGINLPKQDTRELRM